jgi:hypothetical protein
MTESPPQLEAKGLLLSYVHPDYVENSEEVRNQIAVVTEQVSDLAAGILVEIERIAMRLGVPRTALRTRQTRRTQMGWAVGLAIYNEPIRKGRSREILACLLPSKGGMNRVEFYVSGVRTDTSGFTHATDEMRCGMPVLRAIIEVTSDNRQDIVNAAEQWLRERLGRVGKITTRGECRR